MARKKQRTRLPPDLPTGKVHNALKRLGFVLAREGSRHTIFVDPGNRERIISIPRHSRVKANLLRGQLKRIGISEQQFLDNY